jgi:hypothetical protein
LVIKVKINVSRKENKKGYSEENINLCLVDAKAYPKLVSMNSFFYAFML